MRKFRASERAREEKKKGKLDCSLSRSTSRKKEQDVLGSTEAAENSNSQYVPPMFSTGIGANTYMHIYAYAGCYLQPRATVFWSSRMIDRFHRYTSSSVSHILFQHFALSTPHRNSISFLQLFARLS